MLLFQLCEWFVAIAGIIYTLVGFLWALFECEAVTRGLFYDANFKVGNFWYLALDLATGFTISPLAFFILYQYWKPRVL